MEFSHFKVSEAQGVILAHSMRVKGTKLTKGTSLATRELQLLQRAEITSVMGARLNRDDIHENDAALAVAQALCGDHLIVDIANRGRVNLLAKKHGIVTINKTIIDSINLSQTAVTIATLAEFESVQELQVVATIKVIPFAVNTEIVTQCINLVNHLNLGSKTGTKSINLNPFRQHQIGLVLTYTEATKDTVLDATWGVTQQRLVNLGNRVDHHTRCSHRQPEISQAFQTMLNQHCDLILICGASVTVDQADIIPAVIVALGGSIEHFGMPVEPGNMLLLGYIGSTTVIILPGCSRSPKLNGFDWVLQRYLSRSGLNQNVIRRMGVGGLIKTKPKPPTRHSCSSYPRTLVKKLNHSASTSVG